MAAGTAAAARAVGNCWALRCASAGEQLLPRLQQSEPVVSRKIMTLSGQRVAVLHLRLTRDMLNAAVDRAARWSIKAASIDSPWTQTFHRTRCVCRSRRYERSTSEHALDDVWQDVTAASATTCMHIAQSHTIVENDAGVASATRH